MESYIGLIRKERGTSYGLDFPDFPGCVSGGETLDQALANGREALALHVEILLEDGHRIPPPSTLEEVLAETENRDALAVLVELPRVKGRATRINITVDEFLLRRINAAARNRSAFLAEAAEAELERRKDAE